MGRDLLIFCSVFIGITLYRLFEWVVDGMLAAGVSRGEVIFLETVIIAVLLTSYVRIRRKRC